MKPFDFFRRMYAGRTSGRVFLCTYANNRNEANKYPPRDLVLDLTKSNAVSQLQAFLDKSDVPGRATYFGVNVFKARTRSKEEIAHINCLHIDLDFKGILEDHAAIEAVLKKLKLQPSAVVFSGHGLHCYWMLEPALNVEHAASCELLMRRICEVLAGDVSAAEVARVLRIPGTHNSKGGEWLNVELIPALSSWRTYSYATLDKFFSDSDILLTYKSTRKDAEQAERPRNLWQEFAREVRVLTSNFDASDLLSEMEMHSVQGNGIDDTMTVIVGKMVSLGEPVEMVVKIMEPEVRRVFERDAEPSDGAYSRKTVIDIIKAKYKYFQKRDAKKEKEQRAPEHHAQDSGAETQEQKKTDPKKVSSKHDFDTDLPVPKDASDYRWSEPHHDIFSAFAVPTLEPHHVTPRYRDVVFENAKASGFDAGALYESLLTAFSSVINFNIKIKMRPNNPAFVESARLWAMIVGETGTKKTPVMATAINQLVNIDRDLGKEYNAQMDAWNQMDKEDKAGSDKPTRETLIIDDNFSVEGLTNTGIDNPRGFMIYSDEIRSFLTSPSRYNSKGLHSGGSNAGYSTLLKLYNGSYAKVTRADASKEKAGNPNASVLGSIQPKKLYTLASQAEDEDGLVQRFSFVFIDRDTIPKETEDDVVNNMMMHDDLLKRAHTRLKTMSTHFAFSPEGHGWRTKMKQWIEDQREAYDNMMPTLTAALRKWESQFARRCLACHLIENIDKAHIPNLINGETCKQVFNYMTEYQYLHTKAFYDLLVANDEHEVLRNIVEYALIKDKKTLSPPELAEGSRQFRKISRQDIKRYMEKLEAMGYGRMMARGKGERYDSVRIALNPFIFTYHKELQAKLKRRNAIWTEMWKAAQASKKRDTQSKLH